MFEFVILMFRLYFLFLKLLFKVVRFTGAYMVFSGTCIGLLAYGFYQYFVGNNQVVYNKCFIGGAIGGGVFCLYIFIRNIVRIATGDKKLGIVPYMVDRHRFNQAMNPPKSPKAPKQVKPNFFKRRRERKAQHKLINEAFYGKEPWED
jgi:hypothetical protein